MTIENDDSINVYPPKLIKLDLGAAYSFNPEEMTPEITNTTYSNVAFLQVTGRDVFVDFLQLPGVKKDGKVLMPATRVYMSFFSAQKLAEALQTTLKNVYAQGGMEQYKDESVKEQTATDQ